MKKKLSKCWLFVFAAAISLALGNTDRAFGQCGLSFSGPAGNVLTSFIDVYPNYPNSDAYFNTFVSAGQPLPAGTYLTWCVDANTFIDPSQGYTVSGTTYTGALYPSCDPNLNLELPSGHPATCYVAPAVWQQVNYILNHKNGAYFWDVQVAINNLVGGPPQGPSPPYPPFDSSIVAALLNDASANASNWVPQCGNVVGAIYVITNQSGAALTVPVQLLMIEVPYCQITFSNTPASTNLGCNPPAATIPSAQNPVNTNLVSAYSCCGYPVTIKSCQSQTTNNCTITRLITYTATDGFSSSTSVVQTVTWTVDTNAPMFSSLPTGGDQGCNPANLPTDSSVKALVSVSDSCSAVTVTVSHVDSGTPCAMMRTFTITAKDVCGNSATPHYVVYTWKVDVTLPMITSVPAGVKLGCNPATLPTDASIAALVKASDNCTVISTNVSHADSTNSCTVTRVFKITATDECGNVSAASYVTNSWTSDHNGPVITCPPDYTVTNLTGSYCTFTCSNYSSACNGYNGSSYLTNCFSKVYTNGWTFCGATNSGYCIKFTSGQCAQKFVSCSLPPSCLKTNYTNPTSCEAGSLASHTACLKFNVDFSDCSKVTGFAGGFGDLIFCDKTSPLDGMKVRDILGVCHKAVGGCDISTYQCSIGDLTTVCSNINSCFVNWAPSAWCTNHMSSPTVTNVPPSVSGTATVSDTCSTPVLTYTDSMTNGACSGTYVIQRTWMAVDGCGNSNTCTQNIYIGNAQASSISGTVYTDLKGYCLVTPICKQAGISNITVYLYNSNSVVIATTKTDASGNYAFTNLAAGYYGVQIMQPTNCVQTAGTHCLHWVDVNTNQCWFDADNYEHRKGCDGVDRWTTSDGCSHYKNSNGQDCWTDKNGGSHIQSCTYTSCDVPKNNIEIINLAACDAATCVNFAYAGCAPQVSMCVNGPCSWVWNQPTIYNCCITNTGNACLQSCVLNACGQSINCPTLNPGDSCTIPVTYQCPNNFWSNWSWWGYCGNYWAPYTCTHTLSCTTPVVNKSCTSQASCTTYFSAW